MNITVVGAGLSGLTAARLLADNGHHVVVFEKSGEIGGCCLDEVSEDVPEVRIHTFGPRIIHTSSTAAWDFFKRFGVIRPHIHKALAKTTCGVIPVPLNIVSESLIAATIGYQPRSSDFLELVAKPYLEKLWGTPVENIPPSIVTQYTTYRNTRYGGYYRETYQGIPEKGYGALFEAMSEGVEIHTSAQPEDWKKYAADLVVYTGKLDAYFDYAYGHLGYRALRYEHAIENAMYPVAVIADCTDSQVLRLVDNRFWTRHVGEQTIVSYAYPMEVTPELEVEGVRPMYVKPFGDNVHLTAKYKSLALKEKDVIFCGNLAAYVNFDMAEAIQYVVDALTDSELISERA